VWGSNDKPEKGLVGNAAASTGCVERHEWSSCDKVREECISDREAIGRGAQLRLSSCVPKSGQSSWHDLELMGREDLIMKIKKDFSGVSTRGSKVSLMCRIRCNQASEFVYSRRIELEIEEMQKYKKWRMVNQSYLGTSSDPDALKYPLVPPDFFTGQAPCFGFTELLTQPQTVLSDYIRDHFFGQVAGGTKGQLACRIIVLLRNPRDLVGASQLKEEES
jgi:hypothetical protein